MCLNPILIVNKSRDYNNRIDAFKNLRDTESQYIYVNCGVCAECVRKKQMYLIQRVHLESMDSYIFFGTFTYSNDTIRSIDVNGYKHYYADITDFQKMIKRCRKLPVWNIEKYLFVTEYGGKKHRPHFHALFFIPKRSDDNVFTPINYQKRLYDMFKSEWRRNIGSTRAPHYIPLCQFIVRGEKRTYDLHYVNPKSSDSGVADVGFYVSKYCLKFDDWIDDKRKALYLNLEPDEYKRVWSLVRPRIHYSHFFGLGPSARQYIRDCIDKYSVNSSYPVFRNPVSGQLFPLSPYLFNKYGKMSDRYNFFYKSTNPDSDVDNFHYTDIDYETLKSRNDKYLKQNYYLRTRNNDINDYL